MKLNLLSSSVLEAPPECCLDPTCSIPSGSSITLDIGSCRSVGCRSVDISEPEIALPCMSGTELWGLESSVLGRWRLLAGSSWGTTVIINGGSKINERYSSGRNIGSGGWYHE